MRAPSSSRDEQRDLMIIIYDRDDPSVTEILADLRSESVEIFLFDPDEAGNESLIAVETSSQGICELAQKAGGFAWAISVGQKQFVIIPPARAILQVLIGLQNHEASADRARTIVEVRCRRGEPWGVSPFQLGGNIAAM